MPVCVKDILKKLARPVLVSTAHHLYHLNRRLNPPILKIEAEAFDPGFAQSDSAYGCLGKSSSDTLYFGLSSHKPDVEARFFSFDPIASRIHGLSPLPYEPVARGKKYVAQGKIHVQPTELDGKIYFATHIGYYDHIGGKEVPGKPEEFEKYPGGYFVSYCPASNSYEFLSQAPAGEGIITMTVDPSQKRLYGFTWPSGHFLSHHLSEGRLEDLGPVFDLGEKGNPDDGSFIPICRSMGLNPNDGSVYWSTPDGLIHAYRPSHSSAVPLKGIRLSSLANPKELSSPLWQYAWRVISWHPGEQAFYGMIGTRKPLLFRFDPAIPALNALGRLEINSRFLGIRRPIQSSWVSLGFEIDTEQNVINLLSREQVPFGAHDQRVIEPVHFVTYDPRSNRFCDHGALILADDHFVSQAESLISLENFLYSLAWISGSLKRNTVKGAESYEIKLIRFRSPNCALKRAPIDSSAEQEPRPLPV